MARNRRHQSAAIRFGPALKAVALCLLIGGSAVGYVWQKDQIRRLWDRIVRTEHELDELNRQNAKLRNQLNALQSPPTLERLARQYNLGLVRPAPEQIILLPEPGTQPELPVNVSRSRYAANSQNVLWSR